MLTIVGIYIVAVLLKWVWEGLDAIEKESGPVKQRAQTWWRGNAIGIVKKAVTHVPLAIGWSTGTALAAVNLLMPDLGMAQIDAVGPANTVIAAWALDSFGKPFAARLKKRESE